MDCPFDVITKKQNFPSFSLEVLQFMLNLGLWSVDRGLFCIWNVQCPALSIKNCLCPLNCPCQKLAFVKKSIDHLHVGLILDSLFCYVYLYGHPFASIALLITLALE